MHRASARVGDQLHRQRARSAIPPQATISVSASPCSVEVVDDPAVAERDRLEQRAVDLLGRRLQRQAEDHAGQVGVGEDRAVAVPPVERHEAGLARPDARRPPLERRVRRCSPGRRASPRTTRACRRPPPGRPRSRTGPAGSRPRATPVIPGSRTSSGSTTMSQIEVPTTITNVPGCSTPAPGHRHERVDVADRDGDAVGQPEPIARELGRKRPGPRAERRERRPELLGRRREPGVGGLEVPDGGQPLRRATTSPCSRPCTSGGTRRPVSCQTIQSVASMNACAAS